MVLVQFERHTDAWCDDCFEEVHICKYPLVTGAGYAEVPFKEGVETVKEELDTGDGVVRYCTKRSSSCLGIE